MFHICWAVEAHQAKSNQITRALWSVPVHGPLAFHIKASNISFSSITTPFAFYFPWSHSVSQLNVLIIQTGEGPIDGNLSNKRQPLLCLSFHLSFLRNLRMIQHINVRDISCLGPMVFCLYWDQIFRIFLAFPYHISEFNMSLYLIDNSFTCKFLLFTSLSWKKKILLGGWRLVLLGTS